MTDSNGRRPAVAAGYQHAEAFCRMRYRSDDGLEEEWIYNTRDGVTPFVVLSRGGREMQHVDWQGDEFLPAYVPRPGERIFVDLTPERARDIAARNAERFWDDPSYPARDHYESKEELAARLAASYLVGGGEPDLVEVR